MHATLQSWHTHKSITLDAANIPDATSCAILTALEGLKSHVSDLNIFPELLEVLCVTQSFLSELLIFHDVIANHCMPQQMNRSEAVCSLTHVIGSCLLVCRPAGTQLWFAGKHKALAPKLVQSSAHQILSNTASPGVS